MKRVLPLLLLISAIEVYFLVISGKWLFDKRYVNVSEISIVKQEIINDPERPTHLITFIQNSKEYKSYMSESNYNYFYKKHNQLSYINGDTYVFLTILYIIFTILFGIYFIMRTVDFFVIYHSDADIGERFDYYESLFSRSRVDLYNYIDSYDLTPFIEQLYKFFGYDT